MKKVFRCFLHQMSIDVLLSASFCSCSCSPLCPTANALQGMAPSLSLSLSNNHQNSPLLTIEQSILAVERAVGAAASDSRSSSSSSPLSQTPGEEYLDVNVMLLSRTWATDQVSTQEVANLGLFEG